MYFGAFRPSLVAMSGRVILERQRRGMDRLSKWQRRNRRKREAVVVRNAEVLREGERLLAIQLMTDHRNALAAAGSTQTGEAEAQQNGEGTSPGLAAAMHMGAELDSSAMSASGEREGTTASEGMSSAGDHAKVESI
ncbi:hypothetical protein FVE85_3044 [Porphyridium purpureum]|uniref:Uncharacterized protein n=1 Tax=Porphyridium purpureum TaxID=35688 RepID=A0A5J4YVP2_PORPP|nr:hypothetical protein FVE85_3044 [Porphyridium purpureum]|eukprot:POR8809..scf227_4